MRTLQEHYNAIKNGKGNKAQFLKQAKHLFPQYINQYSDFDTATHVLKSKQIISEAAGGVVSKGFDIWNWKKILAEEAKAEEKKVTKEVEDYNKSNFDNKDMKNADNINFNEIMKGFYAELRDEKNNGKTGDEIKDIVVKNLAKDPLYYTKNGEFGVKDLGYTDEAPSLGKPKEPKGKYKSSGYGDLSTEEKIEKVKANVQDSLGDKEAKTSMPKKVKEMSVTPQNSKGVKKMPMPGKEKKIRLKEMYGDSDGDRDFDIEQTVQANEYYDKGLEAYNEGDMLKAEKYYKAALKAGSWLGWTEKDLPPYNSLKENLSPDQLSKYKNMSDQEIVQWAEDDGMEDFVVLDYEGGLANREELLAVLLGKEVDDEPDADEEGMWGPDDIDPAGGRGPTSYMEQKLRSAIKQIIREELEEIKFNFSGKGGKGGRRFIPTEWKLSKNILKLFGEHIIFKNGTLYISNILFNNLRKGGAKQPDIQNNIRLAFPNDSLLSVLKQILNKPENYSGNAVIPKTEFENYFALDKNKFDVSGDDESLKIKKLADQKQSDIELEEVK